MLKKREFVFSDDEGDASMTIYNVFPGVQLVYHSVHMAQLDFNIHAEGDLIEIHYCLEGRIEQQFEDEFFYLMPGDLSVAKRNQSVKSYHFPLRHYHGITIGINLNKISDSFLHLLKEINVQLLEVVDQLCEQKKCFISRSERHIEQIFSELYSVHENIRFEYIKVKLLELLLVLNKHDYFAEQPPVETLSKNQVLLANQIAAFLADHMDQHITITELAKQFNISETYLKNIFKAVYGVPVFSYMRIQKMQSAAQLLIHTEQSIGDIAYAFGYNNTSKFTSAFQKIMGETPSAYRKNHVKYHLAG